MPVWVGHSCLPRALSRGPTPLTLILILRKDDQDVCSNVEERRFSAAMIA